jgi:hypothetical protein
MSTDFATSTYKGLDLIEKLDNPHVVICTSFNDPADPTAPYTALIESVQDRTEGDILCATQWWNVGINGGGFAKANIMGDIAVAHDCAWVDLGRVFGDVRAQPFGDTNEVSSDDAHATTMSSDMIADFILASLTGNPVGMALSQASRARDYLGSLTLNLGTAGVVQIASQFGFPGFAIYDSASDANAQIGIINEQIADLLGVALNSGAIFFGAGGASVLDSYLGWDSALVLKTNANILSTATPSADGHLVTRSYADDRYRRTLDTQSATVGNVGTGEDTLHTVTISAGLLATLEDQLHAEYAFVIANNGNQKRIKVIFGSTTLFDTGATGIPVSADIDLVVRVRVVRTGAATQRCYVSASSNNATLNDVPGMTDYLTGAETLSGALALRSTGETNAASNNDVTQTLSIVEFVPGV